MFFGCLYPGCGLGYRWDRKGKHVSCTRVVGLNYPWLLCFVTLFVGFSFDGFVSGQMPFSLCFRGGIVRLVFHWLPFWLSCSLLAHCIVLCLLGHCPFLEINS